ncbi:hypothetical protein RB195_001147 [Necator americanus]
MNEPSRKRIERPQFHVRDSSFDGTFSGSGIAEVDWVKAERGPEQNEDSVDVEVEFCLTPVAKPVVPVVAMAMAVVVRLAKLA